jgi:hypothetical protein
MKPSSGLSLVAILVALLVIAAIPNSGLAQQGNEAGVEAAATGVNATSSGTIGPNFFISSDSTLEEVSPSVAYNSDRQEYLVVWHNDRAGNDDIRAQRVFKDGTLAGSAWAIGGRGHHDRHLLFGSRSPQAGRGICVHGGQIPGGVAAPGLDHWHRQHWRPIVVERGSAGGLRGHRSWFTGSGAGGAGPGIQPGAQRIPGRVAAGDVGRGSRCLWPASENVRRGRGHGVILWHLSICKRRVLAGSRGHSRSHRDGAVPGRLRTGRRSGRYLGGAHIRR